MASYWTSLIEDILSFVIDFVEGALLVLFGHKSIGGGKNSGTDEKGHGFRNAGGDEEALNEAFQLFGSSLKEARQNHEETRSKIKKAWRRKCLIHHPDRNDNSEESVRTSQHLNHSYQVAVKELDRLQGTVMDDSDDSDNEEEPTEESYNSEDEEERMDPEELFRKQMHELRKERERMKQQQAKYQRRYSNKSKRRKHHRQQPQCQPQTLSTRVGREKAHEAWIQATARYEAEVMAAETEEPPMTDETERTTEGSMDDIDDHETSSGLDGPSPAKKSTKSSSKRPEKPKHEYLESCSTEIVLAIRLGKAEAFSLLLHNEVMRRCFMLQKTHIDECDHQEALVEALKSSRDKDGNTLLHFAAYYESSAIVDTILGLAGSDYPQVILQQNARGQRPVDFCVICNDESFKVRMHQLTESAAESVRQAAEDRKVGTQLRKASKRVLDILCHLDFVATLRTFLSFALIGRVVFGCGNAMSMVICTLVSFSDGMSHSWQGGYETYLFGFHIIWKILLWTSSWLRMLLYISSYYMIPSLLLMCCCCSKGNTQALLSLIPMVTSCILFGILQLTGVCMRALPIRMVAFKLGFTNKHAVGCFYLVTIASIVVAFRFLWPMIV